MEMLVTLDTAGNAAVQIGNDYRPFIHNANGSFSGVAGESGVLVRGNDGSFTLTERDGTVTKFRSGDLRLDYVEAANGERTTAGYDVSGRVTSLTQTNGDSVAFAYNAQGRITQETDVVGRVTNYTYDAAGEHLLSISDLNGTTSYTYVTGSTAQRNHAIASVTYPDGTHDFLTYDARGRLSHTERDGGAQAVNYTYDSTGTATETNALSQSTRYSYDLNGNVARIVDPLGRTFSQFYSIGDRLLSSTGADGAVTRALYNGDDITGTVDALGHRVAFDIGGGPQRLLGIADARGYSTHFAYDVHGNETLQTRPDNTTLAKTYDSQGRLATLRDELGGLTSFTYDTHDLLTSKTLPDGSHVDYTYDAHHNILSAAHVVGASTTTTSYTYDANDHVTKVTYPSGKFITYAYDSAGRRTETTDQDGFKQRYSYDALGRLARVSDTSDTTIVTYAYDALGRLSTETQGNGTTTTYAYNAAGQSTSIVHAAPGGGVTESFTYSYDKAGRIVSAQSQAGLTTYGYDATGQLTNVSLPNGTTLTYAYDAAGNRTTSSVNGTPTNYTSNNVNEVLTAGTTTYAYDARGSMISKTTPGGTTHYTYDTEGRLVSVISPTGTLGYEYDANGTRIAETRDGVRTELLQDTLGGVFAEYNAGGALVAHYTNGLGLESRIAAAGDSAYYNFDFTGNAVELTGNGGAVLNEYSYTPFGDKTVSSETVANRFTYGGKFGVLDAGSGLYVMGSRSYDASLGRFQQNDPARFLSGGQNFYRYAANSPVMTSDPSGLDEFGVYVGAGAEAFTPIGGVSLSGGLYIGNQSNPGDSWLTTLGNTILDSGLYVSPAYGNGASLGAGFQAGGSTSFEGHSTNVTAGLGPVSASATIDPNTGDFTGASGSFGPKLKIPTPPGNASKTESYTFKLSLRNVGKLGEFALQKAGILDTPRDPNSEVGGPNDPSFGRQTRINANKPEAKDFLKNTNSHEPPTPQELQQLAKHLGDKARLDQWLKDHEEWALHDGRPQTEPPMPIWLQKIMETVTPGDPNNILAPHGFGADVLSDVTTQPVRFDGFLGANAGAYGFTILFENKPDASAPAQVVTITQTLDSDLDFTSFNFGTFGWGDTKVTDADGGQTFHQRVDQRASLGIYVDVDATFNTITGALSVTYTSIDPATGDIPLDPFSGFLPANITSPQGDGYLTYSVLPKSTLISGARIDAQATIVFDTEAAINTPAVHNTIDSLAPTSAITAFAGGTASTTSRTSFAVHWTSADEMNGSGLSDTNILYRDNDGPLLMFLANSTLSGARFTGEVGHTYKFFSAANDNAGNTETLGALPDATITVVAPTLISNKDGAKLRVFTDEDGDTYTIALTGPGTLNVSLLDPDNDGKGTIDQIFLTGSTKASKVTVAVKRAKDGPDADKLPDGDGIVSIGDIHVTGDLGSFTAKASDLTVNGIVASGMVGTVSVRDIVPADAIVAVPGITAGGTALGKTKLNLTARNIADDAVFTLGAPIVSVLAASIGDASITAPVLGMLKTTAGAMDADLTIAGAVGPVTVKGGVNPSQWSVGSIGAVIIGGGLEGDIDATGKITSVTVKNGALNGQLTGTTIGAIKITGGGFGGFIGSSAAVGKMKGLASLAITGGSLAGSVVVTGNVGDITVKENKLGTGGAISGAITGRSFGAVTLVGGDFSGSITATGAAAALGKVAALNALAVTGGSLIGDVTLLGALGAVGVKADKAGNGGSIQNALITASKIAVLAVARDVSNSLILAGASLGADAALGGTGANTDTFAAGSIGPVSIGRDVIASTIAAGLSTTNAILKDNDDTLLGITPTITSKIASLIVKGSADGASYFATGKFTAKPKIGAAFPNVTTDGRFKVA